MNVYGRSSGFLIQGSTHLFGVGSFSLLYFFAISRNPIVYNNVGVKTQSADRCNAQTISLPYKGKENGCEGK